MAYLNSSIFYLMQIKLVIKLMKSTDQHKMLWHMITKMVLVIYLHFKILFHPKYVMKVFW